MVEEIGFRASLLASVRKIPFCGPGTRNQGKGRVNVGRAVISKAIPWRKTLQERAKASELSICLGPQGPLRASSHLLAGSSQGSPVGASCSRSSLSAVSKPAYAPPFPSSAFPSLPSPKEDRTSNSLPLATHTRPVLSSPRFLASADSLNSGEGGGEQQGCIILHPCPCFWELSLDTPCQRHVHVHPQSFEGSGPVPARSRGALQRGGPRRSQGLRKQWPCELHDQLSPLSAPWVQQRVRRTGRHRAETGWGWKREPLPLFTADKNWQDR